MLLKTVKRKGRDHYYYSVEKDLVIYKYNLTEDGFVVTRHKVLARVIDSRYPGTFDKYVCDSKIYEGSNAIYVSHVDCMNWSGRCRFTFLTNRLDNEVCDYRLQYFRGYDRLDEKEKKKYDICKNRIIIEV